MTRSSVASGVGRVAGLAAIALLQTYWFLQPVPLAAKAIAAVILAVSLVRPASGLLAFAGLAPLSTAIAGLCAGSSGLGGQLLEQMALGVGAGVVAHMTPSGERTRIGAPALLLAVVALASAASMIPAAAAPVARGLVDAGVLWRQFVARQTAQFSPVWAPLLAAFVIAECCLLGWAVERTVRHSPPLAMRLLFMALIGHAGAALLNFQAVLGGALRTGDPWGALPQLLISVRISQQTDVHAAASALLLAGVSGLGLVDGSRIRRVGVGFLLVLVAVGLWITGSRVALVIGVVTAVGVIGWLLARTTRRSQRVVIALVAIMALGAGSWLTLYLSRPFATRNGTISNSANARLVLGETGFRMFEANPTFGIGVATFYSNSPQFMGGKLGVNYHENAHNNFIQVLAEQGLAGFGALLWFLGVLVIGGARAQFSNPTAARGCLLAALLASVGTWMTGHPLLVPEFAFVFWFYCGIACALTPAMPQIPTRWLAWVLVAGVLVSVPARAHILRDAADLDHLGFGLSLWQHDDALRYREAAGEFALYLPATGRPVEVPIRCAPGCAAPLTLDISVRGRVIDKVSVEGETWQTILLVVPERSRRFELVDFAVRSQTASSDLPRVLLRVGKAMPPGVGTQEVAPLPGSAASRPGVVFGIVVDDRNGNGHRDTGEPVLVAPDAACASRGEPLAGLSIVWQGASTKAAQVDHCNPDPYYTSGDLITGTYRVSLVVPPGWRLTTAVNPQMNVPPGETHFWYFIRRVR